MKKTNIEFEVLNLQRFAEVTDSMNTTTSEGLTDQMRAFYGGLLIDNAVPKLVHANGAVKKRIPKGGSKTIDFHKYAPYGNAGILQEGITPVGRKLEQSKISATLVQYGDYSVVTDVVNMAAVDDNLAQATKNHGAQMGKTVDSVIRDVINAGTNVQYAEGQVSARSSLVGGKESGNHYLTVKGVKMAVRKLKRMDIPDIDGYYHCVVHPDVSFDIQRDPEWVDAYKYAAPEALLTGEVGKIGKVKFFETSNAKVFEGAGADGVDVYSTIVYGADSYGTVYIEGGDVQHIFKPLGSGGTSDPLNQRATVGAKCMMTAVILDEAGIVRIETASSYK